MKGGIRQQSTPRAMIHKRIIDAAAAAPDASLAQIADDVPGASVDLVERVLDEYGDPAEEEQSQAHKGPGDPMTSHQPPKPTTAESVPAESSAETSPTATNTSDNTTTIAMQDGGAAEGPQDGEDSRSAAMQEERGNPSTTAGQETPSGSGDGDHTDSGSDEPFQLNLEDLSEKRYETLRAINAYPTASQRNLAELLGVTAATISQRVNAIKGFDWSERAEFVDGLFDETRTEFDEAFGLEPETQDPSAAPAGIPEDETRVTDPPAQRETASDGGRMESTTHSDTLEERIDALEKTIDDITATRIDNPELLSKVVHACMDAETISTEEEHKIIEQLLH